MNTTPALIYHIYPLGACNAPRSNHSEQPRSYRLADLEQWITHIRSLHVDTVYLGPICESETHGYDTLDYFQVDRRLGDSSTMRNLVHALHQAGLRVVLDAVFNHVGRGFFAFQDVLQQRERSRYAQWFAGLDFSADNGYGDHLRYQDWSGCQNLVKLNGNDPAVIAHLLEAVTFWIREWEIDGLRLDAAADLHPSFIQALRQHCDTLRPGFWLLGEMVHGDYNLLLGNQKLHSVTNYELYKSLYSSFNDGNFFELAYSVNRQFSSASGIYRNHLLYSFADNHDVNRIASTLHNPAQLQALYGLLATLPGIPSLYYGSEWGIKGARGAHDDDELRPAINPQTLKERTQNSPLLEWIRTLFALRTSLPALQHGQTLPVKVDSRQYAFARILKDQNLLVCVNSDVNPVSLRLDLPEPLPYAGKAASLLQQGECLDFGGRTLYVNLPAFGFQVLKITP